MSRLTHHDCHAVGVLLVFITVISPKSGKLDDLIPSASPQKKHPDRSWIYHPVVPTRSTSEATIPMATIHSPMLS